jgi:methyl coenzyme M reductase subunit D
VRNCFLRVNIDEFDFLEEITFTSFQSILREEKSVDERALREAFEALYGRDIKQDSGVIDYNRFRTDMLEVDDRMASIVRGDR